MRTTYKIFIAKIIHFFLVKLFKFKSEQLAIREEITAEELGNTVHGHPTFAEIWMEAAHALHKSCIHAPPSK